MNMHYNILSLLPLPLFLLLLALLTTTIKSRKHYSSHNLPPGPSKLPFIGNLHQLGQNLHQSLYKLSQQHGPLMHLKLGQVPTIVVSEPELAQQVLKTHDLKCCSRPPLVAPAKLSYDFSDVGFSPYGEQWKEIRKICVTKFLDNKKIFSPNFRSIREEEVEKTMGSIASNYASNSVSVNLSEVLSTLNCNIICRVAFGKSYAKDFSYFHCTFRDAQALLCGLFLADYIPVVGWVFDRLNGMHDKLERTFKELDRIYREIIDDHLRGGMKIQKGCSEEDTLDALLRMQREDNFLTQEHIKGLLMDILLAGTDTSSSTVGWAMTELIRHPEIMKKAQEEVRGCVGRKRMIEESDLDKLDYLKAIVKETMRIHPPTPLLLVRETIQHFTLNGYDIPPKSRLVVNTWAMGRDPSSWVRPEEFDPQRFIELDDYGFKFLPFGGGRRICPGKNLGLVMVELILANLLYCFDWQLPHGMTKDNIDLDEAPGVTVQRKTPLCLVPIAYEGIEM